MKKRFLEMYRGAAPRLKAGIVIYFGALAALIITDLAFYFAK